MIEYHNPEATTDVDITPYDLSVAIKGANNISVGFLANGFPDSEKFLIALEAAMQDLEPGIEVYSYNKGNASVAAGDELLEDIRGSCHAVIAAYGH